MFLGIAGRCGSCSSIDEQPTLSSARARAIQRHQGWRAKGERLHLATEATPPLQHSECFGAEVATTGVERDSTLCRCNAPSNANARDKIQTDSIQRHARIACVGTEATWTGSDRDLTGCTVKLR